MCSWSSLFAMATSSNNTNTPHVQTNPILLTNQDPSSIYYIHPSDSSTNQLVSTKFNGEGFNNWKRSMMLILSAKNKLGFVNGTVTAPEPTSPDYKAWERCNDLVISWIYIILMIILLEAFYFWRHQEQSGKI